MNLRKYNQYSSEPIFSIMPINTSTVPYRTVQYSTVQYSNRYSMIFQTVEFEQTNYYDEGIEFTVDTVRYRTRTVPLIFL